MTGPAATARSEPKKTLAQIRAENTQRLGANLEALAGGGLPDVLEPFARAYLGLFLDLPADLPPHQRVAQLADAQLAAAVLEGFTAVLHKLPMPAPVDIARARLRGEDPGLGHVILAGVDCAVGGAVDIDPALPDPVLAAAVCLGLAGAGDIERPWLRRLMDRRPALVAEALGAYWRELCVSGQRYLPGMSAVFDGEADNPLVRRLALPLLRDWHSCDDRVLRDLLFAAFEHCDHDRLIVIAQESLHQAHAMPVRRSMYWYATAFLLAPADYGEAVTAVCGHSKERVLPLLDFVSRAVAPRAESGLELQLPAAALARLLRIIGPVFPPQQDHEGPADRISQKVLRLFELFGACRGEESRRALQWLRSVRVMNRCAPLLDRL